MDPMDKVRRALHRGINYREANYQCVEDYIKDLEKYCLKLEVRYDELCEGYEELVCNWVRLKKENKALCQAYEELRKKYNELFNVSAKINNELSKELIKLRKEHQGLIRELEKEQCRM